MINSRVLLLCLLSLSGLAQVRPVRPPSRPPAKAPVSAPFTLERLVRRLQDVANKEYTEGALVKRVEKDGVDFSATEANLLRLTRAGASPALLETVKRLSPAVHQPPPVIAKPDPTGDLKISCEPAECLVSISGAAPVLTNGGVLVRKGLKHGTVPIEVSKLGFRPFKSSAVVQAGTVEMHTALQPDPAMRQKWGADLNAKMIEALGGEAHLSAVMGFLATGEATVWGQNGKKYSSSIELLIRTPDKAFFRTTSGKRSVYQVDFFPKFRSKSNVSEEESRDLDAALRLYSKYQLYSVLNRLKASGARLSSDTPEMADGAEIHAETSTETVTLVLGGEGRPRELREDVPLGDGVRALYSSYRNQDGLFYPAKVTIVWAGPSKRGIEMEFHSFQINPNLKNESNYRVKKGSRAERR